MPAGTCRVPETTPIELASSEVDALAASGDMRVWGTGAGKPAIPTSRRTPNISASSPTASAKACHRLSGSGPTRTSTSWP